MTTQTPAIPHADTSTAAVIGYLARAIGLVADLPDGAVISVAVWYKPSDALRVHIDRRNLTDARRLAKKVGATVDTDYNHDGNRWFSRATDPAAGPVITILCAYPDKDDI